MAGGAAIRPASHWIAGSFLLTLAALALAKSWQPAESVGGAPSSLIGAVDVGCSAVRDVHVAWEERGFAVSNIRDRRWDRALRAWTPVAVLTTYVSGPAPMTGAINPRLAAAWGASETVLTWQALNEGLFIHRDDATMLIDADGVVQPGAGAPAAIDASTATVHLLYLQAGEPGATPPLAYRRYPLYAPGGDVSPIDDGPNAIVSHDVVVDDLGSAHAVWRVTGDDGHDSILYARRSAAGDWSAPQPIASDLDAVTASVSSVRIAVDHDGSQGVHVVWLELGASGAAVRYRRGAQPVGADADVSEGAAVAGPIAIATDATGRVHVAWQRTANTIGYRCRVDEWQPIEAFSGRRPALACDAGDDVFLAHRAAASAEVLLRRAVDNTPAGANVVAAIGPHVVTFSRVTGAGDTTLVQRSAGPALPAGYAPACTPPRYYAIETTATHSGPVDLNLSYDGCDVPHPVLLRQNGAAWVDVTTGHDATARRITARVTMDDACLLAMAAAGSCPAPPADTDEDGDVDLSDFLGFLSCFSGPQQPAPGLPGAAHPCACLDTDVDGDVDLTDLAAFLVCFNGPSRPPAAGCDYPTNGAIRDRAAVPSSARKRASESMGGERS